MVKFLWMGIVTALVFRTWVDGFVEEKNLDETVPSLLETDGSSKAFNDTLLMVELTLVQEAAAKGAVCLDGTAPAYHLHRGYGSGANSWLIHLQGGAWCNDTKSCSNRTTSLFGLGSSAYMEPYMAFSGILSNQSEENPGFSSNLMLHCLRLMPASAFFLPFSLAILAIIL